MGGDGGAGKGGESGELSVVLKVFGGEDDEGW